MLVVTKLFNISVNDSNYAFVLSELPNWLSVGPSVLLLNQTMKMKKAVVIVYTSALNQCDISTDRGIVKE